MIEQMQELIKDAERLFIRSEIEKEGITIAPLDYNTGIEILVGNKIDLTDLDSIQYLCEKYKLGSKKSGIWATSGNVEIQLYYFNPELGE